MVYDLLRDSSFGLIVNYASGGRFFSFAEERPGFTVPPSLAQVHEKPFRPRSKSTSGDTATPPTSRPNSERFDTPDMPSKAEVTDISKRESTIVNEPIGDQKEHDPYLVTWYGDDDPDNPMNWSTKKRGFVAFSIGLLTFSVYIGSAIYTASIPSIMASFGVSQTYATLGLTLYVLGYGLGPMFLAPYQEMAMFGRNTVYIGTLFIFVLLQIPIFTAGNVQTIMAFRFFTGFFGSPALATGGASMGDIFPLKHLAYVMGIWAIGAIAGPVTGPVIGGFAAQANGWKWPIYELTWLSSFALIFLFFLLPETYGPTILHRRAQRLRKLTGNQQLQTQVERDSAHKTVREFFTETLIRPFVLLAEPMLLFANLYIGFLYSVFYLWFEAFPIVFTDIYHFNLGVSGLPFLGFIVSGLTTYSLYCAHEKFFIEKRYNQAIESGGPMPRPEIRLWLGLWASIFIPTSVLIFGFASKADIPWIVPVIGASLYLPGIFMSFMSLLMYMSMAYPAYIASVLAGNDVFRSSMASVFPLFGHAFFTNLGLGPASAVLAGISFFLMGLFYCLIRLGPQIRKRSKYAAFDDNY